MIVLDSYAKILHRGGHFVKFIIISVGYMCQPMILNEKDGKHHTEFKIQSKCCWHVRNIGQISPSWRLSVFLFTAEHFFNNFPRTVTAEVPHYEGVCPDSYRIIFEVITFD